MRLIGVGQWKLVLRTYNKDGDNSYPAIVSLPTPHRPHSLIVDMQFPLPFATLFLGLSILCVYERIPISSSTIFFSDGSPRRDTCWAETVVHPVLLWRGALFNLQHRRQVLIIHCY